MGILVLVGSFIIFKSRPMIDHYRFEGSASRLAKELEWTHKVALSAAADIDFVIKKKSATLHCRRMTDEPLGFSGGNQQFKIDSIPQLLFDEQEIKELKMTFTRSGLIFPKGKITVISRNKAYELSLDTGENQRILAKET